MAQSPNDPVDIAPDQLDPLMWSDLKNPHAVRVGSSDSPIASEWKSRNYIPGQQGWMLHSNGTHDGFDSGHALQCIITGPTQSQGSGDGKLYLHIDQRLAGRSLSDVHAMVVTAGTTNTTDIQIANVTQGVDMLSTKLTIDSGETGSNTAATPAVINTANDAVALNDVLRIDVDAVSTTPPKGLVVTLGFE